MKLFLKIRVPEILLYSVILLLAASSPAQEINRQVGDPIGGINTGVSLEVHREVSEQLSGRSASRSRTVAPASTFGVRSQSVPIKSATSAAGSSRMTPSGSERSPLPVITPATATQKPVAHVRTSVSTPGPSQGSQSESMIASTSHAHGWKNARHASSAKLHRARDHVHRGHARNLTNSSHPTKQKSDK